jgi:hypothetical protein
VDEDEKAEKTIVDQLAAWAFTYEEVEEDDGERACKNLSAAAKLCADNSVPPKLRKKVTEMVMPKLDC